VGQSKIIIYIELYLLKQWGGGSGTEGHSNCHVYRMELQYTCTRRVRISETRSQNEDGYTLFLAQSLVYQIPKRRTSYFHECTKEFGFIAKSRKGDFHAFCTECRFDADINAVERQLTTNKDRFNTRIAGRSSLLSFFSPVPSSQEDKIMTEELRKVFHVVKQHQSWRRIDCQVKVDEEICSDSLIVKGVTCGKIKVKALCEIILSPYAVQTHVEYTKEHGLHNTYEMLSS